MLKFITGNNDKVNEFRGILPEVEIEQLSIDIPEIQSMDPKEIILGKLDFASKHYEGAFVVEDVSLGLQALNGFPGPLIKWLEKSVSLEDFARLANSLGNNRAEHKITYGLSVPGQPVKFFEGITWGQIVAPRGTGDFGWGPTFIPDGSEQTYGEMGPQGKYQYSPRKKALELLKQHL